MNFKIVPPKRTSGPCLAPPVTVVQNHPCILRKGPAHIVQQPTGKTPGAPDGQSATMVSLQYLFVRSCWQKKSKSYFTGITANYYIMHLQQNAVLGVQTQKQIQLHLF